MKTTWYWTGTAGHEKHGQAAIIENETGRSIAIAYNAKRDAALLAMAPELLECLSAMVDLLKHNNGRSTSDLNAWADKARAAIQKATGEA